MDEHTKQLAEEVGTAINESVQQSPSVAEAIERLREAGFEMELTLKLEIGLRPQSESERDSSLDLTDEDLRVLRSMKIKIDPNEWGQTSAQMPPVERSLCPYKAPQTIMDDYARIVLFSGRLSATILGDSRALLVLPLV